MYILEDLQNTKYFNNYKELLHYCLYNGFTPKTINHLIATEKYHGLKLKII